jgi:3-hydroxyacyl-[acyl-carrier-protein] dehydratase
MNDVLLQKRPSLENDAAEKSWYIDPGQPVFAGHFPGNPIMPGVLVLGLLKTMLAEQSGTSVQIATIKRQKFIRPVLPGDTLTIRISTLETDGEFIDVHYQANVAGGPVAKGSLSFKPASR